MCWLLQVAAAGKEGSSGRLNDLDDLNVSTSVRKWGTSGVDAALEELLDAYVERHKRCLFDETYEGQYVLVSMGDAYTGKRPWLNA